MAWRRRRFLWEKCIPVDDIQYTDDEGHVTIRNNTHRKCLAENCASLSYCEIIHTKEQKVGNRSHMAPAALRSHATCSRFYQLALSSQVAAASEKAGHGTCFMYPEVTEVPMMTPPAYEAWIKRWNCESKSRKIISDAVEVYRDMIVWRRISRGGSEIECAPPKHISRTAQDKLRCRVHRA
jgi:hypothetical protein